jgi:hypothetical protein
MTITKMLACCWLLSGLVLPSASIAPAADPLPNALKATWAKGNTSAFIWYPIANAANVKQLSARTWFFTDAKTVEFDWVACAPGAAPADQGEVHSLSFQPTAICRKAGRSPTIFVAGYIQRTGHVIVEQWDCEDILIGSDTPMGGGAAETSFSKSIRKTVVLLTDDVKPLKAMIYQRYENKLWLFEEEAPNVVWRVDPEVGTPEWLTDASVVPALSTAKSAQTTLVKPTAPDGGGFLVMLYSWRSWQPPWGTGQLTDDHQLFIMRDSNLDGVTDETATITFEQLKETRLYMLHEDMRYP